jgi:hypothetical protein
MSRKFERRVDYDQVAPTYDARFAYYAGKQEGVGAASAGINRIRAAIAEAEAVREEIVFAVDISLQMLVALVEKQ